MERFFLELDPPDQAVRNWPHVVVVGGGFAGLKICHCLARQPVRVTLIDKRNFNLFQPLLYQVERWSISIPRPARWCSTASTTAMTSEVVWFFWTGPIVNL